MTYVFVTLAILISGFEKAHSYSPAAAAPLLERIYSPGLPMGGNRSYLAHQCRIYADRVQVISVDLITNQRTKSEKPVRLDAKVLTVLITQAAEVKATFEVGPTDVPSMTHYAWLDEGHRFPLKATGTRIGENTSPAARKLIEVTEELCQ